MLLTAVFLNVCPGSWPLVTTLFLFMKPPPIFKCSLHNSWMTLLILKNLIKKEHRFMGKGPGKSQTDTSLLQLSQSVGERTGPRRINSEYVPTSVTPFQSFPSFQSPHLGQHFIFQSLSLLHHSLFIHLFHSLVSFSHSF